MCENRQYLTQIQMEIFLVYFIRRIFTLNGWKLLRFVNVFVCFFFLSCAAKNSTCHLGISRLLSCRFRGHDMTNKGYALRRGVQWTFSIHSAYLLKNQSQNKKLSVSVWIFSKTGKAIYGHDSKKTQHFKKILYISKSIKY